MKVKDVGDVWQYGEAIVAVSTRCFERAIVHGLTVDLDQGERSSLHQYTFTVIPKKPFVAGGVRGSASARVFDPSTCDPVDTAIANTSRKALPWGQQPANPRWSNAPLSSPAANSLHPS